MMAWPPGRNLRRSPATLGLVYALWLGLGPACARHGTPAVDVPNPVVATVGQQPIFLADVCSLRAQQQLFAAVTVGATRGAMALPKTPGIAPAGRAPARVGQPGAPPPASAGGGEGAHAAPPPGPAANNANAANDANDANEVLGAEKQLRRAALQQLIDGALLAQAAERAHVAVLGDEVDAAWSAASRAWPEGALHAALRQARATVPEMKARLRTRLLAGKVLRAEALARVVVRDDDIDAYLAVHPGLQTAPETVRLRQLVLPDEDRVHEAQQALKHHAAFADVAARLSVGPEAAAGGELGALTREELPAGLADVAFALRPRQVSRPVQAVDGWHLFWVEERLPARPRPRAELRALAERSLRNEREVVAAADYLARLAQAAHVQVHEDRLSQDAG